MEITTILIASGFLLSLLLLVLLIMLATGHSNDNPYKSSKKVKEDIKKIKAQISDE